MKPSLRPATRRLAALLPFPRDIAAVALWHDLGAVVRGRPPSGMTGEEASVRRGLAAGRGLLEHGKVDGARAAAGALVAAHPKNVAALRFRVEADQAGGDRRAALRTLRELRRLADSGALASLERRLAGEVLVLETAWVPELPSAPDATDPAGPTVCVGRLNVSGTTAAPTTDWTCSVILAARESGLRPIVFATPAGNGSGCGAHIDIRSIDLGPAYPAEIALDRAITDLAWAISTAARQIRPARLVAILDGGDPWPLVTGVAVARATGCACTAVTRGSLASGSPAAGRLDLADRVIDAEAVSGDGLVAALRELAAAAPADPT